MSRGVLPDLAGRIEAVLFKNGRSLGRCQKPEERLGAFGLRRIAVKPRRPHRHFLGFGWNWPDQNDALFIDEFAYLLETEVSVAPAKHNGDVFGPPRRRSE